MPGVCISFGIAPRLTSLLFRHSFPRLVLAAAALSSALFAAEPATAPATPPTAPLPAAIAEAGLPFFEVVTPRDYRGHGQVWSGAEDKAGLLYFGNLGRVLVYDGARWTHLLVPGSTYARGLAVDADDTLWIGAVDELGYAKTDSTGERRFVSLKAQLPEAARHCGEIWKIFLTPRGPLFQTNAWLLRWDGTKFATLTLPHAGSWQMVRLGDRIQLNQAQQGWFRLDDDGAALTLTREPRPDILQGRALTFALPGSTAGETLLGSPRIGLKTWSGGTLTDFAPALTAALGKHILYGGARLPDGRLLLTTLQGGAFLLDASGRLLAHLDQQTGLPDNTVPNAFVDRTGAAWLCLAQGLVRIDPRSWLSWFSAANGVPRGSLDVPVRFQNTLYSASSAGLLRLAPANGLTPARLEPVAGFTDFLGHLVIADDRLVGLGVQGLFTWRPGTDAKTLPGKAFNAVSFTPARSQPGRWFAVTDGGLFSFREQAGTWVEEGPVPNLKNVSSVFEEDRGVWWFGTTHDGALRVTFPAASATTPGAPQIETFGRDAGLPANFGWVRVSPVGGRPLLQCEQGFFRLDASGQRFAPTAEFGARFSDGSWTARAFTPDPAGGLWIAAKHASEAEISSPIEFGLADATGWHPLPLAQLERLNDVNGLRIERGNGADRDDTLWISGHAGLIRLDLGAWRRATRSAAPAVQLREIVTGEGTRLPLAGGWQLPFAARTFTVAFAAPAGTGVSFESTLTGAGAPLVQVDSTARRTFTGLAAGDYRLQLRARDEGGPWSAPVAVAFTVLPPWWWSGWARSAYLLLGAATVATFIAWRTRALRHRAAQLESVVTARTAELADKNSVLATQNVELTRLHQLELDEKISARLAEEKARLEVLRYQLNPHFLFNALTSVCSQLPPTFAGARATIERLTDFCQLTLFRPENGEHPRLADEIKLLRAYLDIEQTRWGELLVVAVAVEPDVADIRVPSLLLLPLVENALKYGRATSRGAVTIRVVARRDAANALVIEVANTGQWLASSKGTSVPSLGIGLENLRQRLTRYYPGAHTFTTEAKDGWVSVQLKIAQLRAPAEAPKPFVTV